MPNLRAIIFDYDGIVMNTEPILHEAYQRYSLARTETRISEEHLRSLGLMLAGRSLTETIAEVCREIGIEPVSIEEWCAFQDPVLDTLMPDAPLMPGAARLIYHLAIHRVRIAIATSAPKRYFRLKIKKHGRLISCFSHIVTADDVAACKPAPDLFLRAAERLGVEPYDCMVIEDAPSGITAAKRAGMTAIAVPPKGADHSRYADANAIYPNLAAIPLSRWGFPRLPPL